MPARRTAILGVGAGILLAASLCGLSPARAQTASQAATLVKSTSDRLVAVVNGAGSPGEKRQQLQEVMESSVDVEDIARSCLGRFWHTATSDQQRQYVGLFRDLLLTKISGHFGEYQGVRVTMGLVRASEGNEIVITTLQRPDTPPTQVDWVVSASSGSPKIVDLLAGGTSLRLTQTSDFRAYLSRHQYDIQRLLDGMQQLVAQNP
jgi:phospholipid transport system substrate-binding protein